MNNMKIRTLNVCAIIAPIVLLAGCAVSEPTHLDSQFGNTVRSVTAAQTYDPGATARNEGQPISSLEGQRAHRTLDVYRQDVHENAGVQNVINFNIGSD